MVKRKHHELRVWQAAMTLVREVYAISASFPREETFCLTSQMRRAAISVPSNIAEGAARATQKEFLHFLHVARGSLSELETHYLIAKQLGYFASFNVNAFEERLEEVFGLLGA
ncbi:four helix bundle protein [Chitinimonas koreensis]|uniref:four helix bundle protein n=1 Tax=Chitinimonas koreensis TaxID=356302 RepID=UPI00223F24F0|nr:four helix bundle protein [Chitinimonas koreensis]